MKYHVSIFVIFTTLISAQASYACSCGWYSSVSELEKQGATVLLASPVGGYLQSVTGFHNGTFSQDVPTRFKVWKTYLGQADEYESIGMSLSSSCATSYPANGVSVIVAYRRNGRLRTGYCTSHQFDRTQLIDYFEHGKDTLGSHFCYKQIKNAYDNEIFTGEFRLDNQQCLDHKPDYDKMYRIRIESK